MTLSDPPAGPSRSRRKPAAENWDDDFDFDLAIKSKPRPASHVPPRSTRLSAKAGESRVNEEAVPRQRDGKPMARTEEEESWDDCPPRVTASRLSHRRISRGAAPAPLVIPPVSPTASRSTKLVKHPSSSFMPIPNSNDSTSSLGSWSHMSRSSPNLAKPRRELRHMKSGEIMPPPPVPRRPSQRRAKAVPDSQLPMSPSQHQQQQEKPGFWRRLSTTGPPEDERERERRNRSSSVGSPSKRVHSLPTDAPPLPPLPPNLRSPSSASTTSETSSISMSRSNIGLSGILRRSTSNLANKLKGRSTTSISVPPSTFDTRHKLSSRSSSQQSFSQQSFPSERPSLHTAPPPAHSKDYSGEVSSEDEPHTTPKRRPVSTVPPKSAGWTGEWNGFPAPPIPPEEPRFATLKRLSSLSKKHGRRLSGGWKFGTSGSTSSDEKRSIAKLETVVGSPSKSGRADSPSKSVRGGSVSVPGSMFKTTPSHNLAETFERVEKEAQKDKNRRQSWNDFVIPRNVLEKQRELKEGIRGVRKFATGVEALKTLLSTHAALTARVASAPIDTQTTFDNLEQEFDQWWEMATVLIEVGSTGQVTTESQSPKRSRRVTLANEKSAIAAEAIRQETRKTSLPEPSDALLGGPLRASPDHWRASTGRQELSKRQLEVLRTMLRTPVSDPSVPSSSGSDRPPLIRGLSGLSTISSGSGLRHAARPSISRAESAFTRSPISPSVSFPSPNQSTYITPSDSMPSPMTASLLAWPQADDKMRKSKVGLAGLKDFLRGLKGKESRRNLVQVAVEQTVQHEITLSTGDMDGLSRKTSQVSVGSPTPKQSRWRRDESSPSLIPGSPNKMPPLPVSQVSPRKHMNGSKVETSEPAVGPPVSGRERKRPGLRGIFRGGSGSWGELVNSSIKSPTTGSFNPPATAPILGRTTATPHYLPTNPRQISDPVRHDHRVISETPSFRSTPMWGDFDGAAWGTSTQGEGESEMTVRPRKSRILGLGWPEDRLAGDATRVPHESRGASGSSVISGTSRFAGMPGWGLGADKAERSLTDPLYASTPEADIARAERLGQARYASDVWTVADGGRDYAGGDGDGDGADADADAEPRPSVESELTLSHAGVIALTPENLPVLLEYLRQCEGKLGEWRRRVDGLGLRSEE